MEIESLREKYRTAKGIGAILAADEYIKALEEQAQKYIERINKELEVSRMVELASIDHDKRSVVFGEFDSECHYIPPTELPNIPKLIKERDEAKKALCDQWLMQQEIDGLKKLIFTNCHEHCHDNKEPCAVRCPFVSVRKMKGKK